MQPGWHLYGPNPAVPFLQATTVALDRLDWAEELSVTVPDGSRKVDQAIDKEVTIYEGTVWFEVTVRISPTAEPGKQQLDIVLSSQACDATACAQPRDDKIRLSLDVRPPAP